MRWLILIAGVLMVVGLSAWPSYGAASTRTHPDPDAAFRAEVRKADCLASGNRTALMETARVLGVSPPSSAYGWAADPKGGFDRVCKVYVAMAARPLLDPVAAPRASLPHRIFANQGFAVFVGALFTYLFGLLSAFDGRRRAARGALGAALREYAGAARVFAARKAAPMGGRLDSDEVDRRWVDLSAAIGEVLTWPSRRTTGRTKLSDFHERLVAEWPAGERTGHRREIVADLEALIRLLGGLGPMRLREPG